MERRGERGHGVEYREWAASALSGETPLAMAIRLGHYDMVKTLLDDGADVNVAWGATRPHAVEALKGGKNPEIRLLLRGAGAPV